MPQKNKMCLVATFFTVFLFISVAPSYMQPAASNDLKRDPTEIRGPDACGECHKNSVELWKTTHHATTFQNLPRSDEAKKIAKAMGIRRIKNESDCLSCHFTSAEVDGKIKPIAGITCESCHGAGKNWIDVHSDFGGKGVTAENEDLDHKKTRNETSVAAGFIQPANLYRVAENCYQCHTVPNEKLVNVGGHPAGSKFELVAWTQGEVRHNVWYTKDNNFTTISRQRLMYVVGQVLDLEFALRGVAIATEKAKYAVAMAKRAKRAEKKIQKIAELVDIPEIQQILAIANSAKLKLNNEEQLLTAANAVREEALKLTTNHDGGTFQNIDPLLPKLE
jgi:hypothetical protein